MRIAVCSDLHLEFGGISLTNDMNADVLILSGDICVAKDVRVKDDYGLMGKNDNNKIHTFFQECCERFPHVIYVMGNHEHYHGDFAKSVPNLREHLSYLKNLHIMDTEHLSIGDVTFIGGTLWTDMNKEDPVTLTSIRGYMNDYRIIDNSDSEPVYYKVYRSKMKDVNLTDEEWIALPQEERVYVEFHQRTAQFLPEDSVEAHKAMLAYISATIATNPNGKFVVVGHHAPSKQSTKPEYEDNVMVNGAYSSNLNEFILDRPQIKLWTHGHTHSPFDYMIGSTRIVCNPRGYIGYQECAETFQLQYVDL